MSGREDLGTWRAWREPDGLRICRDVETDGRLQPQHITYLWANGDIEWGNHEEAGIVPALTFMGWEYV